MKKFARACGKRWRAKETKFGRFLSRQLAMFLLICSIIGGANEYLVLVPSDWIPAYIKEMVPVAGLISFVAGKLTKAKGKGDDIDRGEENDDQSV